MITPIEYDVIGISRPALPLNLNPVLDVPTLPTTTVAYDYRPKQLNAPPKTVNIVPDKPLPPQTIYPAPNDPTILIPRPKPQPEIKVMTAGMNQPELRGVMPLTTYAGNAAIYLSDADFSGYLPITGGTMEGSINMGGNSITNLADPVNSGDAVNKGFMTSNFLPLAGGTMNSGAVINANGGSVEELSKLSAFNSLLIEAPTNITMETLFGSVNINGETDLNLHLTNATGLLRGDTYLDIVSDDNIRLSAVGIIDVSGSTIFKADANMNSHKIVNCANPVDAQDVATKAYGDATYLKLTGGTMTGVIDMSSNTISNLPLPVANGDAVNKAYVDTAGGNYLPLSGGTMTGVIDMSSNAITNLPLPSSNGDAVNKLYVDAFGSNYLPLAGGMMLGGINMNGNDLSGIGSMSAGGVSEQIEFGTPLAPMLNYDVYATNVNMYSYNPVNAMLINGAGGITMNSAADVNINAPDVNITQITEATNFMNLTAAGGIVLAAGGVVDMTAGGACTINAGGTIQILSTGNISVGSGNVLGSDTEIEKVGFKDNEVYKAGTDDIQFSDVWFMDGQFAKLELYSSVDTKTRFTQKNAGDFLITMSGGDAVVAGGALKPASIKDNTGSVGLANQILSADSTGGSVKWVAAPVVPDFASLGQFVQGPTGTTVLTPALKGITYMYISGLTQNFDSTGLGAGDAGWYCYVKNCFNTNVLVQENGSPIAGNTSTLYPAGAANNSAICIILWNGASLKMF